MVRATRRTGGIRTWVLLGGLCTMFCAGVLANDFPYRFEYITTDDGLSQNTVDHIFRDSRGFMWFATWNGLCRFDGYEFRNFKAENHSNSLPDNFVQTITEDARGLLWIGTAKGMAIFDLSLDRFCQVKGLSPEIAHSSVTTLHGHASGEMWMGSANTGLWSIEVIDYQPATGTVEVSSRQLGLAAIAVHAIARLDEDRLWLGTNNGLWEMQENAGALRQLSSPTRPNVFSGEILTLLAEEQEVWIGTDHGLFQYDLSNEQVVSYQHIPFTEGSLLHNTVTAISRDAANNLLVGTLGGLNILQPAERSFLEITEVTGPFPQLNNKFVNSIFADSFGNVWIGTDKGGINKYNLYQHKFGFIVQDAADKNSLSHATVNSVLVEGQTIWIGTAGGGLNRIDRTSKAFTHFRHNPNDTQSISSDFITSILRDKNGDLWLGTWGSGLNKWRSDKPGTFQRFPLSGSHAADYMTDFISSMVEDPRGFLLVGLRSGLHLLDLATGRHRPLQLDGAPVIDEVGCILLDQQGSYWIGTRKGLYHFPSSRIGMDSIRLKKQDIQLFQAGEGNEAVLPGNYIIALQEDQRGRIWIGTYGAGIAYTERRDEEPISFRSFTTRDGLCNNTIYGIEEDNRGHIWLSTDYGLSNFDPEKEAFENHFAVDGLLSNQFYWSAATKDQEGNLFFGGVEGLNYFHPDDIKSYPYTPKATFTKLVVLNSPVKVGEKHHGTIPLHSATIDETTINLSYKDNVISIEFSTLDYFLSEKIQFAYRMEGIDQQWVQVPASRRFASYTNLKGGDYTFQVKASNGNGEWQEVPTTVKFIIHPPFWETGWFRIISILFLVGAVFGYIRLRTHYLHTQTKKLENLVLARTQEIAQQKEHLEHTNAMLEQRQSQVERQKEELETKNHEISQQRDQLIELHEKVRLVNQLRLRFFTNISHEFRTPLTLIIGPIRGLLDNFREDHEANQSLQIINRNAQRLLHLINQLLNFRRLEEGKTKLQVARGDLIGFIQNIYLSFRDLAENQQISYLLRLDHPTKATWFDSDKLENVLYNLLSNAFKFTPEGGEITVALQFEEELTVEGQPQFFEIQVSDNGSGIKSKHLERIFDHFYQVRTDQSSQVNGSGIGLALTRELVHVMRGEIRVESVAGKGSVFTVRLPYTRGAFDKKEIVRAETSQASHLVTQVAEVEKEIRTARHSLPATRSFSQSDKGKPLILIVEDSFDLRAFLGQNLRKHYRVIEAQDGEEGCELACKYTPDLIVSDIMMPKRDGLELCSHLKKNLQTSHIPIILLTSKSMVENWIEGLESGADDYVPKPFNLPILLARIRNLIRSRQQLRSLFSQDPTPKTRQVTSNALDAKFLDQVYELLEAHYADHEFSHDQFATMMCMSRSLLYKKIKALTGRSVTDLVNFFKLKKSRKLLRERNVSISEVAYQTGFGDPKYFSRLFKKFYGVSPSQYANGAEIEKSFEFRRQ